MPRSPGEDLPKRLPLVAQADNRDNTTTRDARLINCYMERQPDGSTAIIKRPGIGASPYYSVTAGVGKGIWTWTADGHNYFVTGNTLYQGTNVNTVNTLGTVDNTTGKQYFFNSVLGGTATVILGNGITGYSYNSGSGLQALSGTQPPSNFQRGFVFLDGTIYYITNSAQIFGSGINDLTTWDPSNIIIAQIDPELGVGLAKQLIYVVAFKEFSTEVFYDNGNSSGSPLAPNLGGMMTWGCASQDSILNIDGDLFWIGQTRGASVQIMRMHSLAMEPISTPWIDRLIEFSNFNTLNNIYAWTYKGEGHTFYILTLKDINLTLAYDIYEKSWSQWTDMNGNYLPIVKSSIAGFQTLAQHESNGNVYLVSSETFTDFTGQGIPVEIITPLFDAGVGRRKLLSMLQFNADQTPGSVLHVRSNDYDYDPNRWTNYRTVDLGSQVPRLTNCGTFHRRSYNIRHNAPVSLRIRSVDLTLDIGAI